mmetsp:Transcript_83789/g.242314  ORF Transcript_83789/g.242314 Transcript_83789/m.242314 type:complete len:229 (-) Transcript_83789:571-1257(-)
MHIVAKSSEPVEHQTQNQTNVTEPMANSPSLTKMESKSDWTTNMLLMTTLTSPWRSRFNFASSSVSSFMRPSFVQSARSFDWSPAVSPFSFVNPGIGPPMGTELRIRSVAGPGTASEQLHDDGKTLVRTRFHTFFSVAAKPSASSQRLASLLLGSPADAALESTSLDDRHCIGTPNPSRQSRPHLVLLANIAVLSGQPQTGPDTGTLRPFPPAGLNVTGTCPAQIASW